MQSLQLPPDIRLSFVAEGAANLVYRITLPPASPALSSDSYPDGNDYGAGTPPPSEISGSTWDSLLKGKLLRLRKDLPTVTSVAQGQETFEKYIKPCFKDEDLVEQTLVELPPGLVETCNEELKSMESTLKRPQKRRGVYLGLKEEYGLLVTDMSASDGKEVFLVEFKPKWLAQSPSAPANAVRCRTCALRALRSSKNSTSVTPGELSFCPLNLVSPMKEVIELVVRDIMPDAGCNADGRPSLQQHLLSFLYHCPLLIRLRDAQTRLDKKGVFSTTAEDVDYLAAMTLRDCTMFLKVVFQFLGLSVFSC